MDGILVEKVTDVCFYGSPLRTVLIIVFSLYLDVLGCFLLRVYGDPFRLTVRP